MNSNLHKNLIKKYLHGNCTPEEMEEVKMLLNDREIKQVFDEIWEEEWADHLRSAPLINKERAAQLNNWKATIHERIHLAEKSQSIPFTSRRAFWRQAAIWLLIVASSASIFSIRHFWKRPGAEQVAYIEKYNPYGTRTKIILPDSSVVHLGAGSKIRFREDFTVAHTRDITLEGEAFFEVVHHAESPFLVYTGDILTEDIGTSFKITAFKNEPVTVEVASGEVSVQHRVDKRFTTIANLKPGNKITWNMNQASTADVAIADINGWKDGRLAYDGKPLEYITADLERWYNVEFSFSNKKLANMPMTITLMANVPINKILEVLSVSGQFKYEIKGKKITINI